MQIQFMINNLTALFARVKESYSDFGEDQIIQRVFGDYKGSYLDIGAGHPIIGSNTYLFYKKGWSGITLEPIRFHNFLHRIKRRNDTQIRALIGNSNQMTKFYEFNPTQYSTSSETEYKTMIDNGMKERKVYYVKTITINSILLQFNHPNYFLSIDCEGYDFQIISDIDWTQIFKPIAIVFEGITDLTKAKAIDSILTNQGYSLLAKTQNNCIYELGHKLINKDLSIPLS
jgi:FkbM family methyltransferase